MENVFYFFFLIMKEMKCSSVLRKLNALVVSYTRATMHIINFIVFDLIRPRLGPEFYNTRDEYANHYTTEVFFNCFMVCCYWQTQKSNIYCLRKLTNDNIKYIFFIVIKRKFKQWWWTIAPISTKRGTTSHHN